VGGFFQEPFLKGAIFMSKNKLIVKDVDFFGDTLKAAKDKEGIVWVGVKWLCSGMGLTRGQSNGEVVKIQDDLILSKGCMKFRAGVFDLNNETLALQLDYVPLWLAKISITPNIKETNPELVKKLVNYQLKAKDVLAAAFLPQQVLHWQETRLQAKNNRLLETDSIKEFVAYAKKQGSQHAERYYCSFTKLANKAAGITFDREKATVQQLNTLTLIEHIISETIQHSMEHRKSYKEIYQDCKTRIEQFKEVAYLTQ